MMLTAMGQSQFVWPRENLILTPTLPIPSPHFPPNSPPFSLLSRILIGAVNKNSTKLIPIFFNNYEQKHSTSK